MKLLVVIVNFNGLQLTVDCLKSVAPEITRIPDARVGLCDNGSVAEEADTLGQFIDERGWSWIDYYRLPINRGFTGGNNIVINATMASADPPEYVLLLNNDTIVHKDAFVELLNFMEKRPDVGIAGSRLEDPDGTPQVSAFRFSNVISEFDRGLGLGLVSRVLRRCLEHQPVPNSAQSTDWVAGASMIIRRQVIHDIGPLDERYFTYFDDIDYCRTASEAGWLTWYVPSSRVVHLVGQTTGISRRATAERQPTKRRAKYWFQARRRYFLKHHGCGYAAMADAAFLLGLSLFRMRTLIQRGRDDHPSKFLFDSWRESVFCQGFAMPTVVNPSLETTR